MTPQNIKCTATPIHQTEPISRLLGVLLLAPVLLLSACDNTDKQAYQPEFTSTPSSSVKEYIFGVHPQRNPKKLRAIFGPVVNYLNKQDPGVHFVFEASRNFAVFDQKVAERQFDFVLPNPYGTIKGIDSGYTVFGKMGNDNDLRGLIIVRRDSTIATVADLKGKTLAFPAPTAFGATIMPKYFLHSQGLNVSKDFQSSYVGSMESSLMNVYQRNVAAGTAYPPAWRSFIKDQPEAASKLKIMWETPPLPDNSLMARNDMPPALVARVTQALLHMHENPEGRAILASMDLSMFKPATNADYDIVRSFINKYEASIGPIDPSSKK